MKISDTDILFLYEFSSIVDKAEITTVGVNIGE